MSSFLRTSKRHSEAYTKREIRKRIKAIHKILKELTIVAEDIRADYPDTEFTEDNLVEIASEYTDRKLEKFEKIILLGKLYNENKGDIQSEERK